MRLVCPNCDAKYEVPEDAIPDAGRDVQCANCSHAWFQMRERTAPAPVLPKEPEASADPVAASVAAPAEGAVAPEAPVESPQPSAPPMAETVPDAAGIATAPQDAVPPPDPTPGPPAVDPTKDAPMEPAAEEPKTVTAEPVGNSALEAWPELAEEVEPVAAIASRAVDEGVLSILREEAEREAKARRGEGQSPDAQPEAAPAGRKKGGKKSAPDPVETARPSARRDLLPDVEEINSTLRPSDLPEDEFVGEAEAVIREGRGAFRSGFLLVLSVAILGGAIYISSAWLANLIPALEGPLKSYVGLIDWVRLSLDSLMQSATRLISGEQG